jgi:hypothetical protein
MILIRIPSGNSEMRKFRHSREGGNPEGLHRGRLDSRLRGNDGLAAFRIASTLCYSLEYALFHTQNAKRPWAVCPWPFFHSDAYFSLLRLYVAAQADLPCSIFQHHHQFRLLMDIMGLLPVTPHDIRLRLCCQHSFFQRVVAALECSLDFDSLYGHAWSGDEDVAK